MTEHQKLLANMCHIEDYIAKQRLEHHRMVVSNFNNDGNHNPIQRRMQYNVHEDEIRIDSESSLEEDSNDALNREQIIRSLRQDREQNQNQNNNEQMDQSNNSLGPINENFNINFRGRVINRGLFY